ncbi:RNA pyrophosphohydrolase [Brevundimonas albigilva]|uniref:RNA pyrophosphohydrolase n=1 Tax=Brevundimonas albigilva TaxID=1312364 RepID=UPI00201B73B9|nr:RNA pyrophosphohydrolase [Brevundimonas albigilva]UQV17417.1 RNA pyrophosphohydrolase [Brevundimonas albigilva]
MADLELYRPNVGVVLFNRDGLVWYGQRHATPGPHNWQFPQGGVDKGEDLEAAARRELREETGVTSVEPLGRTKDWILYDFPPEAMDNAKAWRGFKGQKQRWFAYRFVGDESEIDLGADADIEFDAWRWGPLSDACDLIVPFKRPAYERVVKAFARFAG